MTTSRQADPGGWVAMFPITAAWTAACQQSAQAWIDVSEQMGQATLDLARAQADGLAQALSLGLETASGMQTLGGLLGAGFGPAASESAQLAQAALRVVEDIGPGDPEYVPLPD